MWRNSCTLCNARAPPGAQVNKQTDANYWTSVCERLEELLQKPSPLNLYELPHTKVNCGNHIVKVHGIVHDTNSSSISRTCRSQIVEILDRYDHAGEPRYFEQRLGLLFERREYEDMGDITASQNYRRALLNKIGFFDELCNLMERVCIKLDPSPLSKRKRKALKKADTLLDLAVNDIRWLPSAHEAYELTQTYYPNITRREEAFLNEYFKYREEYMAQYLRSKIAYSGEKIIHVFVGLFHEKRLACVLSAYEPAP